MTFYFDLERLDDDGGTAAIERHLELHEQIASLRHWTEAAKSLERRQRVQEFGLVVGVAVP